MKNNWKVYCNWHFNCSIYLSTRQRKGMECSEQKAMDTQKQNGKNTKTMEWMSFLLFGFIMTFICRVCTLMCELFKWMLFINLYVYPFRAYSHTTSKQIFRIRMSGLNLYFVGNFTLLLVFIDFLVKTQIELFSLQLTITLLTEYNDQQTNVLASK